jgi:hypothetical protein
VRKLHIALAFGLVVFAGSFAVLAQSAPPKAAELSGHEALLVEFADTPSDHRALAAYYHDKAVDARAQAATHRSMAKHYAAGKLMQRDAMKKHCTDLAQKLEGAAADYDSLAAEHETEANH